MHPTKNDIPAPQRAAVVQLLNNSLANLIDLQLQAKQAHWNVKGPTFIALHELFDRVAESVEGFVDTVAERIAALGGRADWTIGMVGQRTKLAAYPLAIADEHDHVDAVSTALATVGQSVRGAINQATEFGDSDTADLFTEISRDIDKYLWFVESHLHRNR